MAHAAVLLTALLATVGSPAADDDGLNAVSSAHFNVHCESFYPPSGVLNDLEFLHARMSLDLVLFAPWAKDEKVDVYVFKDSATYRARTGAQPWTSGHAQPSRRRIYTYESDELRRVLAHELAHVFFDDFFASKDVSASSSATAGHPPLWLTEGVAVSMEWDYGLEKDNPFLKAKPRWQPLGTFVAFDYQKDVHEARLVSDWYLQAYSLVRYLMRSFPGNQFFDLCDGLRRGLPLDEALRRAYGGRFSDAAALETAWRESLGR